MPIVCANCGAQNPDGNLFCQNCGQPLGVSPPGKTPSQPQIVAPSGSESQVVPPDAGPPPAGPPPVSPPPPTAPVPPAYVPAPPPQYGAPPPFGAPYLPGSFPPPHRLHVVAIVGSVVAAIIVLVLAAAVVHAVSTSTTPTPAPVPTSPPPPTPAPTTAITALPTTAPTTLPTSGPTAAPTAQPTSAPLFGGAGFSTATWEVSNLNGFTKVKSSSDDALFADSGGKGLLYIGAFKLNAPLTLQSAIDKVFATIQKDEPDARDCGNGAHKIRMGTPAVAGADFIECYTFTPQNGAAFLAADENIVGVNGAGDAVYQVELVGPNSKHQALVNDAAPVFNSITWKLTL